MLRSLEPLETNLNDLFVKKSPALPAGGKKALVQYLPWINLVLGVLTLYAVWVLWHWAHYANALINYANSISAAYGAGSVVSPVTNRMGLGIWLGLLVLLVEALLYIAAFPGTRDRKKAGWDLMFYAALVNVVYGAVIMFTDYGGGLTSFLVNLVVSAFGLYLLFQIRPKYLSVAPAKAKKS